MAAERKGVNMSTYTQELAKRIREQNEIRDIYKKRAQEAQTSYDTAVNTLKSGGDVYSLDDSARAMYRNIQSELAKQQREEQERLKKEREQMSGIERFGHTLGDFFGQGVGGLMKFGENFVDYFGTMFGADEDWLKRDWTQELYMDKLREGTKGSFLNDGKFGNMVQSSMFGLGNMLPSLALNAVPYVGGALSTASFMVNAAGGSTENALQNGATRDKALLYGTLSGISEGAIEKISGGIGGVGKGIVQSVGKSAGKSAVAKGVLGTAKKYTGRMIGEGLEEVASDVIDPLLRATYTGKVDYSDITAGSLAETFGVGAMTSGLMLGGQAMAHNATAANRVRTKLGELNEVKTALDKRYYDGKLTEAQYKQGLSDINWLAEKTIKTMNRVSDRKAEKIVDKVGEKRLENAGILQANGKFNVNQPNIGEYNYKAMTPSLANKVDSLAYKPTSAELTAEQESLVKDYGKINNGKASIVFTDDIGAVTEDGSKLSANGAYSDGVIYISRTAENPLREVMKHEFTHALEGTKAYGKFASFVIDEIQKSPVLQKEYGDFAQAFIETAEQYKGVTAGDGAVVSEIVAKYSERLFSDPKAINRLARANKGLAMKVLGMVTDRLGALGKGKGTAEMRKFLRRAEGLYRKAITAKPSRVIAQNGNTANEKDNSTNIDENSDIENTANIDNTTENTTKIETNSQNTNENSNIMDGNIKKIISKNGQIVQYDIQKSYSEQIDDALNGELNQNQFIYVGKPSSIMLENGFANYDIVMSNNVLKKLQEKHGLSISTIKELNTAINNPIYILESNTVENAKVIVTDLIDSENRPIIVAIHLDVNTKIGIVNILASAYGRNSFANFLNRARSEEKILYENKEKAQVYLQGATIAQSDITRASNNSISNSETNVNRTATESLKNNENTANIVENSNKEVKFSLKKPIEYKKNLIAVHNLSESKLLDSLTLGGFAMPSIAVLKTDGDHNSYGDISVVFRPSAVDPKANADNKIYSADAYTPRFPKTEYSYNMQAMRDLADKLNTSVSMLEANEFNANSLDDIYSKFERKNEVKQAFIAEKGLKVVPVLYDPEFSRSLFNNSAIKEFLASGISFKELVYNESVRGKLLDLILNTSVLKSFNQKRADKINEELNDAKNDKSVYEELELKYNKDIDIAQNKAEKVETPYSYSEGLSNLIEEHSAEYSAFVKALVDPVIDKKWLRNNKDFYTPRGNPRSFKQLHDEYTADNALRLMKELGMKNTEGGEFGYGLGELKAALSNSYDSIEAVHKDESRLKKIVDDELSVLYEKCEVKLIEICDKIAELINHDNIYIANEIASNVVYDIVRTKTDAQAKAVIKRDYSFEPSDEILSEVRELAREIAQLPVEYFEAKPARVVNFDEIAAIVAPSNVSSEVKSALARHGIEMVSYDKSNASSRVAAVNSIKDIKFSLKANKAQNKAYTHKDADAMVRGVIKLISDNETVKIRNAKEISDEFYRNINNGMDEGAAAVIVSERIVDEAYTEHYDPTSVERAGDVIEFYNKHIAKKFNLDSINAELKEIFGGNIATVKRVAHNADGLDVAKISEMANAMRELSIDIDSKATPAEIFTAIYNEYRDSKEIEKGYKQSVKDSKTAKERNALVQKLAKAMLFAFDKYGSETKLYKRVKELSDTIESLKNYNRTERAKEKSRANIVDEVRLFKELSRRGISAQIIKDSVTDSLIKIISRIVSRKDINVSNLAAATEVLRNFYTEERIGGDYDLTHRQCIDILSNELANVDKRTKDLTAYQLDLADKMIKNIRHYIRTAENITRDGKNESARELGQKADDAIRQDEELRNKYKVKNVFIKLFRSLRGIVDPKCVIGMAEGGRKDGVIGMLYDDIKKAETNQLAMQIEFMEPMDNFFKENKGYAKRLSKSYTIGKTEITFDDAIAILLVSKRAHASATIDGVDYGGVHYQGGGFSYELDNGKTVYIDVSRSDIERIEKSLSELDLDYIDILEEFYNKKARKAKKETDRIIIGSTTVVDGEYYYPISRADEMIAKKFGDSRDLINNVQNYENLSFNKHVVANARNPIKLRGSLEVFTEYAKLMSAYATMTQALKNFSKVMSINLNAGIPGARIKTLRSTLKETAPFMEKYMDGLLQDIQGTGRQKTSKLLSKMRDGYIKAVLGANVKTWFSQWAGVPAAMTYLSPRDMAKGFAMHVTKEEFIKHSKFGKAHIYNQSAVRSEGIEQKIGSVGDFFMRPIGFSDKWMHIGYWQSCRYAVQRMYGHELGTEANYRMADELYEKVARETQSTNVMSERSAMQRSESEIMRTLTTFASDAQKQLSRIVEGSVSYIYAQMRYKEGLITKQELRASRNQLVRSASSFALSNAVYVAIGLLFNALLLKRDEEGKKWDAEDYAKAFGMGMIESYAGLFPIFRDMFNKVASGYDIEHFSYSMINDLVDSTVGVYKLVENRIKGEDVTLADALKTLRQSLYSVNAFLGMPTKNIAKYAKMIVGWFDEGALYKYNSLFYPAKKSALNAAIEEKNDRLSESIFGVMLTERGYGEISMTAQKKLLELYTAVYKDGISVIPSNVPNKVTWKDGNGAEQEKDLKAADKAVYRANNAKAAKDIEKLLKSGEFSSLSKKEQADAVKKIYTYYNALSKAKVTENEEINTQMLLASLLSVEDMAILSVKNASLVADKYANGKIIPDSKKRKLLKLLNTFGLTFAEKELVRVILGYSPSNPKIIKQTIRHSSLTSEEKAYLLGKI